MSPAILKLLPEPLPAPYQRPLTLCVELNDSLVHLVWDVYHVLLISIEIRRMESSIKTWSEAIPRQLKSLLRSCYLYYPSSLCKTIKFIE